jgi:hypothetical protein
VGKGEWTFLAGILFRSKNLNNLWRERIPVRIKKWREQNSVRINWNVLNKIPVGVKNWIFYQIPPEFPTSTLLMTLLAGCHRVLSTTPQQFL